MREWRAAHIREYDFGAKGRQATDAVWKQALYDEAAEFRGEASATVLLGLNKAFESVPLEHVLGGGYQVRVPQGDPTAGPRDLLLHATPHIKRGGG